MQLDGVLFFPVTPFDDSGAVAPDVLAEHVQAGLDHGPGGVFLACGTGEFHALDISEYATVVERGVAVTGGAVPVLAGAGGALPHAVACARTAERSGADGLLVLPPYLVSGPPAGIVAYVEAIADASDLPLILYQRGAMRFPPQTAAELARHPKVIGFKDGLGDLDAMLRIVLAIEDAVGDAVGDDFLFFNGLPTAEFTQLAYRGIGVPLYSSAAFAVVPEVALVKAGITARGLDVGGVRAPLRDPSPDHLARLRRILDHGLELAGHG